MSRKYIAIAFLMTTVLALLTVLFVMATLPNMAMSPDGAAALTDTQRADADHFGLAAAICALSSIIFDLVAWIGALLATARQNKWAWFICILIFNWPAILIYLLVPDRTTYLHRYAENESSEHLRLRERMIE